MRASTMQLGDFHVVNGVTEIDSATGQIVLNCPGIDTTKKVVYLVALVDDFADYYNENNANKLLGYCVADNSDLPSSQGTFKYNYAVNSSGTAGSYYSNRANVTLTADTVTVTNSTNLFIPGMSVSWAVVWKD